MRVSRPTRPTCQPCPGFFRHIALATCGRARATPGRSHHADARAGSDVRIAHDATCAWLHRGRRDDAGTWHRHQRRHLQHRRHPLDQTAQLPRSGACGLYPRHQRRPPPARHEHDAGRRHGGRAADDDARARGGVPVLERQSHRWRDARADSGLPGHGQHLCAAGSRGGRRPSADRGRRTARVGRRNRSQRRIVAPALRRRSGRHWHDCDGRWRRPRRSWRHAAAIRVSGVQFQGRGVECDQRDAERDSPGGRDRRRWSRSPA